MNAQSEMSRRNALYRPAISLILALGFASATLAAGPSSINREVDSYPPSPGKADAPVVEAETVELATLHVSNGSVITLLAAPELGELGYAEVVPAGAQPVLSNDQLSPLEIFLALTPAEMPVPDALVDLAIDQNATRIAAQRALTDRYTTPIEVSLDSLGLRWEPLRAGVDTCSGSDVFTFYHCETPIDPDHYLAPISFCDAGLSTSLGRASYDNGWRQRERSYARTRTCGASVTIWQQVWSDGAWQNLSTQSAGTNHFIISAWNGPLKFRRTIRERTNNAGGFRAYSDFYIYLN